mgnify:CR=1 FL=1
MAAPSWYNTRDQELYDQGQHYLPQEFYTLNPSSGGGGGNGNGDEDEGTETATTSSILNRSDARAMPVGPTGDLLSNYNKAIKERQRRLEDPNKITSFFNNLTGGGQRTVDEMKRDATAYYTSRHGRKPNESFVDWSERTPYEIDEGDELSMGNYPVESPLDTRKTAGIPLGIGSMIGRMMPNSYYKMSPAEQIFTQSQKGYTGDTVHGRNLGNQDVWGTNITSGWGNYPEAISEDVVNLRDWLGSTKASERYGGAKFELDEKTGLWGFEGGDAARANKMNQMNLIKFNHRLRQKNELEGIKRDIGDPGFVKGEQIRKEQAAADDRFRGPEGTGDYDEYSGIGEADYSIPAPTYKYEGSDEQDKEMEGPAQREHWDDNISFAEGGIARLGFQDGGNYKNIFETGAITQTPNNPFRDDGGPTENIVDTTVVQDGGQTGDGGSSWFSKPLNWMSTLIKNRNPTILGTATQKVKDELEEDKLTHANIMGADEPDFDRADSSTWGIKGGGRVGLQAGGDPRPGGGDPDMYYEAPVEEIDTTTETGDDTIPYVYGLEDKIIDIKDFEDPGPGVNFDWSPTDLARIQGNIYPTEEEMFNVDGTLSGTLGDNLNWESNFNTDQGITDTNINLNNLYANIDAHKNLNQIGYANNIGDWDYDINYQPQNRNLNLGAYKNGLGINLNRGDAGTDASFTYTLPLANGGLAGLL